MGPIAQGQLIIAPAFYATMLDLFGPVKSYVPGYERQTRGRIHWRASCTLWSRFALQLKL